MDNLVIFIRLISYFTLFPSNPITGTELARESSFEQLRKFFDIIGFLFVFTHRFMMNVLKPPYEFREIAKHMYELGVKTFRL